MTTNFKQLVEILHDSLIEANVDDKQFDIIWSAINDVHSKLRIYGVVEPLKDKKTISYGLWRIKSKDVEAVNSTFWTYKGNLKTEPQLRKIYDKIKHTL